MGVRELRVAVEGAERRVIQCPVLGTVNKATPTEVRVALSFSATPRRFELVLPA
jgi:hypothetical protein